MKKILIAFLILASASPAVAQQTTSPREQALTSKLMEEINQNLEYRRALIEAQATVEELKKQVTKAQEPKQDVK